MTVNSDMCLLMKRQKFKQKQPSSSARKTSTVHTINQDFISKDQKTDLINKEDQNFIVSIIVELVIND